MPTPPLPAPVAEAADRPRRWWRLRRRLPALAVAAAVLTGAIACQPAPPSPPLPTPKPPVTLSSTIEATPPYEPAAKVCDPAASRDMAGPIAFRDLLLVTYGPAWAGITRPCSGGGTSEHYEGRALDWGVDARIPDQLRKATAVIDWLRATDDSGNANAMARRLGIQYFIYDKKMYGSWNGYSPTPYSCAAETSPAYANDCHINHVHFSFTWAGAAKATSFWRGAPLPTVTSPGAAFSVGAIDSTPVTAPFVLAGGRTYTLEVSGTYKYGPGATQVADAACAVAATGGWSATAPQSTIFGTAGFRLKVAGGSSFGGSTWTPVTGSGECDPTGHRYRMTIRPYAPLGLYGVVLDPVRSDNSGVLTVKVVAVA